MAEKKGDIKVSIDYDDGDLEVTVSTKEGDAIVHIYEDGSSPTITLEDAELSDVMKLLTYIQDNMHEWKLKIQKVTEAQENLKKALKAVGVDGED